MWTPQELKKKLVFGARLILAIILLYWAFLHFFYTDYFINLHKGLYQWVDEFYFQRYQGTKAPSFKGYWSIIATTVGVLEIILALLLIKYEKVSAAFATIYSILVIIFSNYQKSKEIFAAMKLIGVDPLKLPLFICIAIVLFSGHIMKPYEFVYNKILTRVQGKKEKKV